MYKLAFDKLYGSNRPVFIDAGVPDPDNYSMSQPMIDNAVYDDEGQMHIAKGISTTSKKRRTMFRRLQEGVLVNHGFMVNAAEVETLDYHPKQIGAISIAYRHMFGRFRQWNGDRDDTNLGDQVISVHSMWDSWINNLSKRNRPKSSSNFIFGRVNELFITDSLNWYLRQQGITDLEFEIAPVALDASDDDALGGDILAVKPDTREPIFLFDAKASKKTKRNTKGFHLSANLPVDDIKYGEFDMLVDEGTHNERRYVNSSYIKYICRRPDRYSEYYPFPGASKEEAQRFVAHLRGHMSRHLHGYYSIVSSGREGGFNYHPSLFYAGMIGFKKPTLDAITYLLDRIED